MSAAVDRVGLDSTNPAAARKSPSTANRNPFTWFKNPARAAYSLPTLSGALRLVSRRSGHETAYLGLQAAGAGRASRVRGLQRTSCWRVAGCQHGSRRQSVVAFVRLATVALESVRHASSSMSGDPAQPIDQGCCFVAASGTPLEGWTAPGLDDTSWLLY